MLGGCFCCLSYRTDRLAACRQLLAGVGKYSAGNDSTSVDDNERDACRSVGSWLLHGRTARASGTKITKYYKYNLVCFSLVRSIFCFGFCFADDRGFFDLAVNYDRAQLFFARRLLLAKTAPFGGKTPLRFGFVKRSLAICRWDGGNEFGRSDFDSDG